MSLNVPLIGFGGSAIGFEESKEYPGCFFRTVNGATEWLNPPNNVGTEYRTMARYKNKPVYEKVINFGALPNQTTKSVPTGFFGVTEIISFAIIAKQGDFTFTMTNNGTDTRYYLDKNYQNVCLYSDQDLSALTGMAFIKYIK